MVNLLHISRQKDYFVFMANNISGGKYYEKPMGEKLADDFVADVGKGKIKTLITNKAFLDRKMISRFKTNYCIDTLIPLKKNMDTGLDAKGLSKLEKMPWKKVDKNIPAICQKR